MRITEIKSKDKFAINMTDWDMAIHLTSEAKEEYKSIINWFVENNWTQIGNGIYASVWEPPYKSDMVVKVAPFGDKCWEIYHTWTKRNQNNPHVPKIQMFRRFDDRTRSFFIAGIERLEPLNHTLYEILRLPEYRTIDSRDKFMRYMFVAHAVAWANPDKQIYEHVCRSKFGKSMGWDKFLDSDGYLDTNHGVALRDKVIELVNAELYSTPLGNILYQIVHSSRFKQRCFRDLHGGNIMIRPSTGEWVVTDPVGTMEKLSAA